MNRVFKCKFQVRGYELDGYGHVNHAVYLNYFEYARWCMIEASGCGADYFKSNNRTPVIARAEIDFRAPCFLAEHLTAETRLIELRSRMAVFYQKVFKADEKTIAAAGKMTLFTIDSKGRALSLPVGFGKYFS